jgi:tRNA-specific adenosine deaminase 1
MPDTTHLKPVKPSLADLVAALVLKTYIALPNNGKPAVRSNGVPEWTVLAAVVCEHQGKVTHFGSLYLDSTLHCLSLATGVKCLSHDKVKKANGLALHDSHAEILAIRGFNR